VYLWDSELQDGDNHVNLPLRILEVIQLTIFNAPKGVFSPKSFNSLKQSMFLLPEKLGLKHILVKENALLKHRKKVRRAFARSLG
jgi:hypothetical protein